AAILLMSSAVRTTGVLGKISESYIFPNYETDRLIDIGNTLTRLEILPVLNFLTMGFIKSSVSLYVTSLGTAQLLNLRTYRPVVIPLGIMMI
ncbi:MAG TPA: spore gernimation protein, partial [Firmicutes bacterium]|nr:spore gernimation protein [Bacillota bacterium]